MSSSRKGIPAAAIQSPIGTNKGMKMKIPSMTAEYMEAMQTLNETNLNQACNILLDDQNDNVDKLLDLYNKCNQAYKVIKKQQPATNAGNMTASGLPGAPNLNMPASKKGNGVAAARPKLKKVGTGTGTSTNKVGNVPLRRTMPKPTTGSMKNSLPSAGSLKSLNSSALLKNSLHSPSSSFIDDMNILPPASKKARVSPTGGEKVMAPPQAALNFLAKLNKDKEAKANQTKDKDAKNTNSKGSNEAPEPRSPVRKNPPRGSMHHRRSSGP
jgi:hypothetical protein